MGLWSSIGSFISGAVSIVSSVASSLGSAIGSIGGITSNLLKVAAPYLSAVMQVVQIIGTVMGLLKPDENPEELGDRAMNASKTPEDFDTTKEYMEYLRTDVEFDKEEFEKLSDDEKLARSAIGTSIVMKGINESKGFDISMDTWISLGRLHDKGLLSKDTASSFLDDFKDNQTELNNYVNKEIKGKEGVEVAGKIADTYAKLEPTLSSDEINDKVMNSKLGD